MVPDGTQSAASLPSNAATRSCSALTVGSSPNWSSPTGAAAIAARMASVGFVTVSDRRSIIDAAEAPPYSSVASIVMVALSTFDTGQPALALLAAVSNCGASAPGTLAFTVRCTAVIENPSPTFSSDTAADVRID